MEYYVEERKFGGEIAKTAWSKAREDAERICNSRGYRAISVCPEQQDRVNTSKLNKLRINLQMYRLWKEKLSVLQKGDTLVIQLPVIHNSLLLGSVLKQLKQSGVRIIGLIHDLEAIRMSIDRNMGFSSRVRIFLEEKSVLQQCHRLIVHNGKMKDYLAQQGVAEQRMVELGIFDYLVSTPLPEQAQAGSDSLRLIVAGNLHPDKAGYVYEMPDTVQVNLYGVFYRDSGKENHRYFGAFDPEELADHLSGGFGLIWDGPSPWTCEGTYGEYLRYNNPHKTSLYLAAGIPVAIWEHAAMADFVRKHEVGVTAASVEQAARIAAAVTPEEYGKMCRNARSVGSALRCGDYLNKALDQAVNP